MHAWLHVCGIKRSSSPAFTLTGRHNLGQVLNTGGQAEEDKFLPILVRTLIP